MKKIVSIITALGMLLCAVPVFGDVISTQYSLDDANAMVISGCESGVQAGTEITVSVFYQGESYSSVTPGTAGQLAAVLTASTAADGTWSAAFIPAESADYDIYAGAAHRDAVSKSVYVMADRRSVIETIETAGKSEVAAVFGDEATLKGIVADLTGLEALADTGRIGEILYGIRTELADSSDVLQYLDLACAMAVLEQARTAQSLEDVLAELEKLDAAVENLSVYQAHKTPEIGAAVAKRLAKAVDGGVSGLADAFTDALILGGVEGSSVWADVAPFMELLNNADYQNNVYQVSVAVVKNAYDTIDDLNRAVAAAVNAQGGSGTGSGGTGSSGTGGGTGGGIFGAVSQQELSALAPEQPEGTGERLLFRDVPEGHWAFDSVHYLYWQEIVSGDDNGFFEPDRQVTRAEMLKMLCNAFGLAEENRASFSDVPATAWYYGYAGAAAAAGLVNGYDGNLSPDAYLTREDMAVLVYRFAAYAGVELAAASPSFTDAAEISDYALDAVGALSGAGLISGMGDGTFAPQAGSTRAQVAAILYRFITTEAKGVGA